MPIAEPPGGLAVAGATPIYGAFKTGSLVLNGDMELTELVSGVWVPSLFTLAVESGMTAAWRRLATGVYAGTYSLECSITGLASGKSATFRQDVPLNWGSQRDQLGLWHRLSFVQKAGATIVTNATARAVCTVLDANGSVLATVLNWTSSFSSGWTRRSLMFIPSNYMSTDQMAQAMTLRVTLYVATSYTGAVSPAESACFDNVVLEAECALDRNFSLGGQLDEERETSFERTNDALRTLYQASSGNGTAKRIGTIPFRFVTESQRDKLHGIWLYGARAPYVVWYPVMAGYPDSIDIVFDRKWSFPFEHADTDIGYRGTLAWMEH